MMDDSARQSVPACHYHIKQSTSASVWSRHQRHHSSLSKFQSPSCKIYQEPHSVDFSSLGQALDIYLPFAVLAREYLNRSLIDIDDV